MKLSDIVGQDAIDDYLESGTTEGRANLVKSKVIPYARSITPVDTGEWRDSWELRVDGDRKSVV